MTVTRKQEIWALALWVERAHGERSMSFLEERIGYFESAGPAKAVAMWHHVARRFEALKPNSLPTV